MSEQQSQKHGVCSEAQKTAWARDDYAPVPPSNPVTGAFGEREPGGITDQDVALKQSVKDAQPKNEGDS